MEHNIGRSRLGRPSQAHSSARREAAAGNPPAKRGRRRQGQPPSQGTHDNEAGGSGATRSRSRRQQVDDVDVDAAEDGNVNVGQYLADDADWLDEDEDEEPREQQMQQQPPHEAPHQPPHAPNLQPEDGYPGGPSNFSLLTEYHKHRAIPIWNAEPGDEKILKKSMRAITNGKRVINLPKMDQNVDWFWRAIEATGLEPLTRTNYSIIDHGVLTAFAERWHSETSTFHIPIGEVGITLDDVQCLLHLPIEGKLLNHRKISRAEGVELVNTYLGVSESKCWEFFIDTHGPHITYGDLAFVYTTRWEEIDKAVSENRPMHEITVLRQQCIRAFLLFLVCTTIFSNRSQFYVDVVYLSYFQDLSDVNQWNWGVAALTYLQHYLDDSCKAGGMQVAGYLSFYQGWIMMHFPKMTVWRRDPNYREEMPRNATFSTGQGHRDPVMYRQFLDNMQVSDFEFCPYDGHRHVRPLIDVCWFSGWLRCGSLKAKHLPERVLRQFGHVQGIPRDPAAGAPARMSLLQIDRVFMEEVEMRMIDEEMRGPTVVRAWDHVPGYISWFYKVSHPIMRPIAAPEAPPRPANLEVLIEEQESQSVPDTLDICRNVRTELRRALEANEALPGTPIYETVNRVLGFVEPAFLYRSRRRLPGRGRFDPHDAARRFNTQ
ncbi:unnamed protein product [Trifolium pratense]|uniref:Uncharacterized protein n=1 Tax=Trifolium pratense TaxID=57577 RepID=A0ACB0JRF9_TRIPR|nr:unnamed protein product [Trifolium pratense]